MTRTLIGLSLLLPLLACGSARDGADGANTESPEAAAISPIDVAPFKKTVMAHFDEPWAMTFLPQNGGALITEKKGKLRLWKGDGDILEISGTPQVAYGGQGGLGDVITAPDYAKSRLIYLSWAEANRAGKIGAAVGRARLNNDDPAKPRLESLQVIWRQSPKVEGRGHFSHRLAFSPDGQYLFITSGDRQKMKPAQDMTGTLGKIVRLFPDGRVPHDNPFAKNAGKAREIWSLGHRNVLGISFDGQGNLWEVEMGPRGGDELNLVRRGANYGWPLFSNGNHYDGKAIPDHAPLGGEKPVAGVAGGAAYHSSPAIWWNPSISPSSLLYYNGAQFPQWKGSFFIGALSGQALIRISQNGTSVQKADQWPMDARIREVEQGPDGAIWLLEDGAGDTGGRLIRLTPPQQR